MPSLKNAIWLTVNGLGVPPPFWKMGYPAVMITDTAFYRNPNYHSRSDTIDTLDFDRMAELLTGLKQAAKDMTSSF